VVTGATVSADIVKLAVLWGSSSLSESLTDQYSME